MEKKQDIDVSVVMPVLNGMPYFERALSSVRQQSIEKIEIIVVDAGSTDGTLKYVEECLKRDDRILLLHSDMRSMGAQYNAGMDRAVGKYVAFCESDDYYSSDMLKSLYEFAEKNDIPDSVKSDFVMFFDYDKGEMELPYHILSGGLADLYGQKLSLKKTSELMYRDVNIWNGIYRRDFIEKNKIRFNETQGAAFQDIGFVEQVHMLAETQMYIRNAHYHYRRDNLNASTFQDVSGYVIQEFEYMLDFLSMHEEQRNRYSQIVFNRLFGFFDAIIGKKFLHDPNEEILESLRRLQMRIKCYIDSLPSGQRFGLLHNAALYIFLHSVETYCEAKRLTAEDINEEVCQFGAHIDKYKRIVVIGAGERGQSIYIMLRNNSYRGDILLCDNSPALYGTVIIGEKVHSVADAVGMASDSIFVISNRYYEIEISNQLIDMGIKRSEIICAPDVSPHSAMEIKWR